MHIDVIIATRDRPDDLGRMLGSLAKQLWTDFTVVVIDQSDDTSRNAEAVAALADERFRHVPTPSRGKSRALNEAITRHSTADVIAFSDDDCQAEPDWLSTVAASVERHPDADIIFGQLNAAAHDPAQFFVPTIEFETERVFDRPLLRSHGLLGMGADMVIRRRVFTELGLFDEDLGPGGRLRTGEECELMYRCLNAGRTVVQDPTLVMRHHGLRAWEGGLAERVLSEGFYATMAGHGKHVRRGDWRAVSVALHEALWNLWTIAVSIPKLRRPFHIRRLGVLAGGFWAGLRRGPAWPPPLDGGSARGA